MRQAPLFELQLDQQTSAHLADTARWAKFLAVVGFIFCALILCSRPYLRALFFRRCSGIWRAVRWLQFGRWSRRGWRRIHLRNLYFRGTPVFSILHLYRFATKTQMALRSRDQELLAASRQPEGMFSLYRRADDHRLGFMALGLILAPSGRPSIKPLVRPSHNNCNP